MSRESETAALIAGADLSRFNWLVPDLPVCHLIPFVQPIIEFSRRGGGGGKASTLHGFGTCMETPVCGCTYVEARRIHIHGAVVVIDFILKLEVVLGISYYFEE